MMWTTEEPSPDALAPLVRHLDQLTGIGCVRCRRSMCGHEVLFSVAMGVSDAAQCLGCLAHSLQREPKELRDTLVEHFRYRSCYGEAWMIACEREGLPRSPQPRCLWEARRTDAPSSLPNSPPAPAVTASPEPEDHWDAGDMSCGELVLALRRRMQTRPPGSLLRVTAHDPAAPQDLPAWCRVTGNALVQSEHPVYLIRKKEN